MIHTADGTLLYSPRDLVAYLEGDFAAWCERIVVGSPELTRVRCRSVEEMKLVNLLCHLMQYAEESNVILTRHPERSEGSAGACE